MTLLLGLDIGTTSIKAVLYDPSLGRVVRVASRPTPVQHPSPGWSEHDPEALWQTLVACVREVAADQPVVGLAVSSFAEAGLPLDAAGEPLYPIIAWYDRRTEPQASWWEAQLSPTALHGITGQRVSPSFGANKWLWIREHAPQVAARMTKWVSVPDYLLFRLTGKQVTDQTIASRTLLFDQRRLDWSDEMASLAGLDLGQLPQVLPSGTKVGNLTVEAAAATGLSTSTACVLGGHDHLCAALAAGADRSGVVVDSTGTGQALLVFAPDFCTGPHVAEAGYACYAHVVPGQYAFKGGLKAAGGAIEWLVRQLAGSGGQVSESMYAELEAAANTGIGKRAGPLWLPHLIGSGTPEGDRHSRGALVGLQIEHDRGDIFRGMIESLAFWVRHNLAAMESLSEQQTQRMVLLGGATGLRLLSQMKADVLNRPVRILGIPEAAATGAALLAGVGAGAFGSPAEAVGSLRYDHADEILVPEPARADWYGRLYQDAYVPLYAALRGIHHAMGGLA